MSPKPRDEAATLEINLVGELAELERLYEAVARFGDQRHIDAEALAITGLGFIAADPELLPRFLALTGIEASSIRLAAREPGFLAGVLTFILGHEQTLHRFAEHAGTTPGIVAASARALPFGSTDDHLA